MNPYNLQTSALVLAVVFATACGSASSDDAELRDESFLALMGSDGKADGLVVTEGSAEARAVLEVANTASFVDLRDAVGLDQRATANIIARRDKDPRIAVDDAPYQSLRELDATPWIGMRAFVDLLDYARAAGFVDLMRNPVQCSIDSDCGDGVCHADRCYDVREINVDLTGTTTLGVAHDGSWRALGHAGGTTVREARGGHELAAVETTSYDNPDITSWLPVLPDGTLAMVTRSGAELIPEFGPSSVLSPLNLAVDAAYESDGTLFVALEARDVDGTARGIVIARQDDDGWREELKRAFEGDRAPSDPLTTRFTRGATGHLQLWVDVDGSALRFDRDDAGGWRQSMRIDMAGEGFGSVATDREVQFVQAADGTTFIHRATWNFARLHQVLRIENSTVTAVIDMPTATRRIAPHPDGSFSVINADGALSRYVHGTEVRGEATLSSPPDGDEQIAVRGDDLYVLDNGVLTIFTARR